MIHFILYTIAAVWILGSVFILGIQLIGLLRMGQQNYIDVVSAAANKPVSVERFHWAIVINTLFWPITCTIAYVLARRSR